MKLLYTFLFTSSVVFSSNAQFGILEDIGNAISDGAEAIGNVYQDVTQPIFNEVERAYDNTLKAPVDQLRSTIESAVPEHVMNLWKTQIDDRLGPYLQTVIDVGTGKTNVVDGVDDIVEHTINQGKELIMIPELLGIYATALGASEPVPTNYLNTLAPIWGNCTSRDLEKSARYVVAPWLIDAINDVASIAGGSGNIDAITLNEVIIFRDGLSSSNSSLGLLGHELIHVAQYEKEGSSMFLINYIKELIQYGYEKAPTEVEAYKAQDKMLAQLEQIQFNIGPANNYLAKQGSVSNMMDLAAFEAIGINPVGYIQAKLNIPNDKFTHNDLENLAGFAFDHTYDENERAAICRSIADGAHSHLLSPKERLQWTQRAVSENPEGSINWYFLAAEANRQGNVRVEYDALISLANIMLMQEFGKAPPQRDMQRIQNACSYLNRSIMLGGQMNWGYNDFFDVRLPLVMLADAGLNFPVNAFSDQQMLGYGVQAYQFDRQMGAVDNLHFQIILVNARINQRIAFNSNIPQEKYQFKGQAVQLCNQGGIDLRNMRGSWGGFENWLDAQYQMIYNSFPF
jgi:hypothetical protein